MDKRKAALDSGDPQLSLRKQCKLLEICRSSLYYKPTEKPDEIDLLNLIREIWQAHPFYGYRKITAVINDQHEWRVNKKRVQRLMNIAGIRAIYPKPNLSKKRQEDSVKDYLLKGLEIIKPDQVWMVDITYLKLKSRFVYLVAFIDVYSRYIVSWGLSYDLGTENSLEALRLGLIQAKPEIINSDQGCQYTSDDWIKTLGELEIKISHDGVGRWADNIYIERFWRSIKYEAIHLNEFDNYGELYLGVRNYIDFYNQKRPHQSLKYKTPAMIYQNKLNLRNNKAEELKQNEITAQI